MVLQFSRHLHFNSEDFILFLYLFSLLHVAIVCCTCRLASVETLCGFLQGVIYSRWADSHYGKWLGIKRKSRLLAERWANSLESVIVGFCLNVLYFDLISSNVPQDPVPLYSWFFFFFSPSQNPCFNIAGWKILVTWCLCKINAQVEHLINMSLQRTFIVKGMPPDWLHWLLHGPGRHTGLGGISNHCSTPWKTDASVQS